MQRKPKLLFGKISSTTPTILILGVLSGIVYLLYFNPQKPLVFSPSLPTDASTPRLFFCQFITLYAIYLIAIRIIFRKTNQLQRPRRLLLILLVFGIFFRVCLIRATPTLSSDIYRYVWDGRVQTRGINPYLYPPSSESLSSQRDEAIYPHINRKNSPTIYPAGAQVFFLLSHWIAGNSLKGLKAIFVFFDVLTMLAVVALLRAHGLQETRCVVYAWNPLVILEIAHSGHLEAFTVFLVVLAFLLQSANRKTLAILSLACATATKIYPALLLPAFINRRESSKLLLIFFSSLVIVFVPYWSAGEKILGFLPTYFKNPYESFNLGLKFFLMRTFGGLDYFFLTKVFVGIVLATGLIFFFKDKQRGDVLKYSFVLIALHLVFMPAALHPWYLVWLIPLLAFYPSPAWLLFSCTVAFSYLKYASPEGIMPLWVLHLEYIPLFALLILEYIFRQRASRNWFPYRMGEPRVC